MRRGLTIVMIGIVILFCVAIVTVYLSIGSVITSTIENYGTAITQTKVTLRETEFSPTTGEAELLDLKIANPAPYKAQPAFLTPRIKMQIDPQTVNSETIIIKRIEIEAPEITYEITNSGDNLRTIRFYIKEAIAVEARGPILVDHAGPTKKFIINDLYITNAVVIVEAEELMGKKATAVLDNLHLEDLGQSENGLYPAALIEAIYRPLLQATTLAALSTDLNLSDQALNILRGAGDETEEVIDQIRGLLEK
ncbi:hypothetical protein [Sneathiella sp. HT1-7]|uniref:hypothetical protein n=1 Tax=Sneathiella sp. HT1-7 TaxID=2887192 RepID=UPI001D147EB8|nr:hypothetical protein [Sneathiella sp. HT1-7]MCC3304381.1 hypothetical protein [Sneathiella sp. HT1-7]